MRFVMLVCVIASISFLKGAGAYQISLFMISGSQMDNLPCPLITILLDRSYQIELCSSSITIAACTTT